MSASASAASKPDFSGNYVLNRQASTLSPAGAAAIQTGRMRIEHREPNFRCHFRYEFAASHVEGSFELLTDGNESRSEKDGIVSIASLGWDGDVLVFIAQNPGVMIFRHELLDGGRRLRLSEQNRGMGHDQDNIFIFERE